MIIGGGQSGLAASYSCKQQYISHIVLDANAALGDSWRTRYESLQLFSPRKLSALRNMRLPGDPDGLPVKNEVADYLHQYAYHFELPVRLNQHVTHIRKSRGTSYGFETVTSQGQIWQSSSVIIATGPHSNPYIPEIATQIRSTTTQMHSSKYRSLTDTPGKSILIVGGGNSGAQIACELALAGKQVAISTHHPLTFVPQTILGMTLVGWLALPGPFGIFSPLTTRRGRFLQRHADTVIGYELRQLLRSRQVVHYAGVTGARNHQILFEDGAAQNFDTVIWCTGYVPQYEIIQHIQGALDALGLPVHTQGLSKIPGLYFMGLSWQRSMASTLIMGAAPDAQFITRNLKRYLVDDVAKFCAS